MLMVIFPDLRTVLLERFYQDIENHYWTVSKRVYGIMMNYTFSGAIFHGMMSVVAYYYGLTKNKKFLLYIPVLLIIVVLNGRTGLIISVIGIAMCTFMLVGRKYLIRIIKYALITLLSFLVIFQFLRISFPSTYTFIMDGVGDLMSAFSDEEKTGDVSVLADDFSENLNFRSLIVGNGYRIQEKGDIPAEIEFEYSYSDMGYLNDMFMGGIPYMLMLYIPTIMLIMVHRKGDKGSLIISLFFVLTIIICNIKGEVFRSSMIISGVVFIKAAMEQIVSKKGVLSEKNAG